MATPIPSSTAYPEIPDKLYFRIGEVSRLAGVKPYVLRYWETEFPHIGPKKSGSNHRLYRRKDVELILEIKHLLYEKRYTIEGARKQMSDQSRAQARPESRSEPRPLAKPAQAAVAVPSQMAMAIGSSMLPVTSTPVPPVTAAATPSGPAGGIPVGATTASTAVSKSKPPVAKASPSPDLVGSIRRELQSLLDLLSR